MVRDVLKHFQCPRCGYHTDHKSHMYNHLYKRKKTCHTMKSMIDLSDDIKEHIINFGKYHLEPLPKSCRSVVTHNRNNNNMNQNINNYYILNTILSKMDPVEKLTEYINYKGLAIPEFEDYIEDMYSGQVSKLENEQVRHFSLNKQDLLNIVDNVTSFDDISKCNMLYDAEMNKFSFYKYGKWQSILHDAGVKEIIENIQKCYLDSYECYLIKKHIAPSSSHMLRQQVREHLEEYYKFLGCFNMEPYVKDKTDALILGLVINQDSYNIQEEWMQVFRNLQKLVSIYDSNKVQKEVANIAKNNTKKNIVELNKKMMEVFNMDEEFKQLVITKITCAIEEDSQIL